MPRLHTQHLYENENIFRIWTDLIFKPSIDAGHAEMSTPDFDIITRHGYQATMDFPVALYYEQIMEKYPDCKFILTTRENTEVWFSSWDTMTKSISTPANLGGIFVTGVQRYSIYLRWLFAVVNQDDTFLTSLIPKINQNKEAAISSYEEHNKRVQELIPQHKLLEYSVKQGRQPLCNFLEAGAGDCPDILFSPRPTRPDPFKCNRFHRRSLHNEIGPRGGPYLHWCAYIPTPVYVNFIYLFSSA